MNFRCQLQIIITGIYLEKQILWPTGIPIQCEETLLQRMS